MHLGVNWEKKNLRCFTIPYVDIFLFGMPSYLRIIWGQIMWAAASTGNLWLPSPQPLPNLELEAFQVDPECPWSQLHSLEKARKIITFPSYGPFYSQVGFFHGLSTGRQKHIWFILMSLEWSGQWPLEKKNIVTFQKWKCWKWFLFKNA